MKDDTLRYWATSMMGLAERGGKFFRGAREVTETEIRKEMSRGFGDFGRKGSD